MSQDDNIQKTKWCPYHGYPEPCYKCGYVSPPADIVEELLRILWDYHYRPNLTEEEWGTLIAELKNHKHAASHTLETLEKIKGIIQRHEAQAVREAVDKCYKDENGRDVRDLCKDCKENTVREERERIWGELEDIRCNAAGEYLPGIERLMKALKQEG